MPRVTVGSGGCGEFAVLLSITSSSTPACPIQSTLTTLQANQQLVISPFNPHLPMPSDLDSNPSVIENKAGPQLEAGRRGEQRPGVLDGRG